MAAVAPMDLVVKTEAGSIPLRCSICPKKPNFSDLSHLLTHISSKSHLAHRFKVELKARADRDALEAVRQYEDWCERYGINALLAERMTAKEQKRTSRRGRPSNAAAAVKPRIKVAEPVASHHGMIKPDPEAYYTESLAATGPYGHNGSVQYHNGSVHYHNGGQGFDPCDFQTPILKRSRSDLSVPDTPDNVSRSKYRRWPSEMETNSVIVSESTSETIELLDDDNDYSKLKGVRYPGMGLFDSADSAQKRMRNQRKDDSVLKLMEQASSGIEPTEFVWTEDGEFQRTRDVYASPSIDGSPDRKFEERDTHRRKRGRLSAASAAPDPSRQRTATTRVTRQMASRIKSAMEGDPLPEDDDNGSSRISSHSHGSTETYDIFRDPPKPSPAPTEGSLGESGFELRRRPALQSLNANRSMVSPGPNTPKAGSYFPSRDTAAGPFTSQQPISTGHYFQHQQTLGVRTFNPLCAQNGGGYYNPYGYQSYGNETKPPTASFQAINSMNFGMPFNGYAGTYASDSGHGHVDHDFDL
ncbi:hypothetical protein BT67DRAFT_85604 [Trichocladium antarcticum]|uniref:Uncharacterized protein n=1 Tax=Trichocladium antarcticum TaxID=1450529 RepID=A0AAN6UG21_9PEZI|nr:hypothetical protein BT67DRAFT_85604 [Trichocladium antarcticum]